MNITILVVDDVETDRFMLKCILEKYLKNAEVLLSSSGKDAIDTVRDKNVDLIILDIQMPELDGFEVAKILKDDFKTSDIQIIFLTGTYKKEEFRKQGFKLGAIDYLIKPVDNDQLISKLKLYIKLFNKNKELQEKEEMMIMQSRQVAIGETLNMISHQWRQPLSVISTIAGNMKINLDFGEFDKEEFKSRCRDIETTTQKLSKTIDTFSSSFSQKKEQITFCINDVLEDVCAIVSPSLGSQKIKLIKEFKSTKIIKANTNELKQVIVSLLTNAIEAIFMRKIVGPTIFFKSWDDKKNSYFKICDNAKGIKKDNLDKIFEPYFSTKSEKNGVGLGLYMSKFLIQKQFHGKITAINTKKGACFRVSIPIYNEEDTISK